MFNAAAATFSGSRLSYIFVNTLPEGAVNVLLQLL